MIKSKKIGLITTPKIEGNNSLFFAEAQKHIPFKIKRFYFIQDMQKDEIRGKHAHKKLQQVLFCVKGEVEVILNDGKHESVYILNKANIGLYVGPSMWREFRGLSSECIIFVVASEYYDEKDYIRNYFDFIDYTSTYKHHSSIIVSIFKELSAIHTKFDLFLKRYNLTKIEKTYDTNA